MPILPNTKDESLNKFLSAQNSENTALVNKFNSVSGHKHTGAAGDGPVLPAFDAVSGHKHTGAAGDAPKIDSANATYASGVSGFTPATVKAALDALAGARIVEKGTNANGDYLRFENGFQICLNKKTYTYGSADTNLLVAWTFPAAFRDGSSYFLFGTPQTISPLTYNFASGGDATPSQILTRLERVSSGSTVSLPVYLIAIGWWK